MSFTTPAYALLLAVAVLAFRLAPAAWRAGVLVAASAVFYASWNISLCMLMFGAAVFAWQAARDLRGLSAQWRWAGGAVAALMLAAGWFQPPADGAARNTWLLAAAAVALLWLANLLLPASGLTRRVRFGLYVGLLLALLGVFKYANFFIDSLAALAGVHHGSPVLQVLLPVGISFYVFQKLSFLVDVWRGDEDELPSLPDFCAWATFFPQLVAGPIERVAHLLPQLRAPQPPGVAPTVEALVLLATGFFKKLFVADNCALVANYAFDSPHAVGTAWLVLGAVAFAVQIYGDFSGYTDIARGSALLMGVRLSSNFELPYLAASVTDFWRRWHITLSTWLRDYLYKPLGGARAGQAAKYRNLVIVMALGGLWHGASWNFVLWGLYWGALLVVNHTWRDLGAPRLPALIGWALTLLAVLGGWVLFRATDLSVLPRLLQAVPPDLAEWRGAARWVLFHTVPLLALHLLAWRSRDEAQGLLARPLVGGVLLVLMLWLTLGSDAAQSAFIYFQF